MPVFLVKYTNRFLCNVGSQVNCLSDMPQRKLAQLSGIARFCGLGTGWGGGDLRLLEQADVVVLLTLQDISSHVQQRLRRAPHVLNYSSEEDERQGLQMV